MKFLLDTSYLFALLDNDDSNYLMSLKFREKISREGGRLFITPFLFEEAITLVSYRLGKTPAITIARELLADEYAIIPFSPFQKQRAFDIFTSVISKNFSFCDALTLAAAEEEGVDVIVSFDADLKKIKGPWKVWG